MIINNKRALAYIQTVHNIQPISGADNIELVHVLGWCLIAKKGEFQEGDKAVYIEIDSKVPADDERFAFLQNKDFKVKTYKLNKFKVISQGLALPLTMFPELGDAEVNTDVTEALRIVYSVAEDNSRKAEFDPFLVLKNRRPALFRRPLIKWLIKHEWGKKLVVWIFGRKDDRESVFPDFVRKTDEERIENLVGLLGTGPYDYSEKVDGTSCTFAIKRIKRNKFKFYVCSRNRALPASELDNFYWEAAIKYDIQKKMEREMRHNDFETLAIQGEIVGAGIQGNPYKFDGRTFFTFNIIIDGKRMNNNAMEGYARCLELETVPLLGTIEKIPSTMEEMKALAEGTSILNHNVLREGLVYRGRDGEDGFKNVALSYLLRKK